MSLGTKFWLIAGSLASVTVAGVLVVGSEFGSSTLQRLRPAVALVQELEDAEDNPDDAMTPLPPPPPGSEEGGPLEPPGDEVLGGEVADSDDDEAVEGGEAVSPGSAVTGEDAATSDGPTTPEPPADSEPVLPAPGPTPPPGEEEGAQGGEGGQEEIGGEAEGAISEAEVLLARIEELEGRLAEAEAAQDAQAAEADERIAELEEQLDELNRRGQFLEENRSERIERLDSGLSALRYVDGVLAGGSSDIDGDLARIAADLAGAATDAARYAGAEEAQLSAKAQASVQAAREALARSDLYAARIYLGYAMEQAREARAAAETGRQDLFPR